MCFELLDLLGAYDMYQSQMTVRFDLEAWYNKVG